MKLPAILLLGAVSLLAAACGDQCDDFDRLPTGLLFRLNNAKGETLVGKAAGQYNPDSLRLLNKDNKRQYLVPSLNEGVGAEYALTIDPIDNYNVEQGQVRLYLYLSKTDTDTLDIAYRIKKGNCFDEVTYTTVGYNSRPGRLDLTNGQWVLTK